MSGYSAFARYYDDLTANIDYKKRGEYFHSIIQRFKTTKENILLDLACGTGSISEVMAGLGYDVIGVDNSDEMLGIALDKKFDSGLDIQYLCQDMRKLDMFGTVDITVCALDSINHLASIDDVRKVFENVAFFSEQDGLFIFDVRSLPTIPSHTRPRTCTASGRTLLTPTPSRSEWRWSSSSVRRTGYTPEAPTASRKRLTARRT